MITDERGYSYFRHVNSAAHQDRTRWRCTRHSSKKGLCKGSAFTEGRNIVQFGVEHNHSPELQ